MVEAKILNLAITDKYFIVMLKPENTEKVIPISIATLEAQSIMTSLIGYKKERPLTHDLINKIFNTCNIKLVNVVIDNIHMDTYFAKLVIEYDKNNVFIDSRPSDAIALALEFKCPIYVEEHVIEKAGIILENGEETPAVPFVYQRFDNNNEEEISQLDNNNKAVNNNIKTKEEIQRLLDQAIKEERYEDAAKYRDELDKLN
ncbi:bifunctional nuclease family protein [uncultured Brachyspira sp.]|uniref:bifunctional nuclease family protein n=1 Tax=uncultured Brachyspira sp. TaxID=221953 RepID=UPI0025CF85CC|nr:bifunctional nuclease family protein [uncultured Brachyspira sp.]